MDAIPTTGSDYADFLICEATGRRCGRWKDGQAEHQEALRLLGILDDKKQFEKKKENRNVRKRSHDHT